MMGFIFFVAVFLNLSNFSLIPELFLDRQVYNKQSKALFYRTSSYIFSGVLILIPLHVLEAVFFCIMTYFSVGMSGQDGGARFFVFLLLNFTYLIVCAQIFRVITYLSSNEIQAQLSNGIQIMFMVLFSGYICARDSLPDPWIWAYWINPMAWIIQAMMVNEFTSTKYDFPNFPGSSETFGYSVLDSNSFETKYEWVWYAFAVLIGFYILFFILTVLALKYMKFGVGYVPVAEEAPLEALEDGNSKDLPFEPLTFAFRKIWYTVKLPSGDEVDLLKGVDGFFKPYTMTALMGSSGAGKTTLLDVLAGRKNSGTIKGLMTVNGKPKEENSFRRMMAYVEQFDSLLTRDTAREALEFSAALRLPKEISNADRQAWVETVIKLLELGPIANTLVGTQMSGGMSFEQKKRVSIGVELASNPSILFLDEPTTGLDSRAAQVFIRVVRRLARAGRSIVCTIHQPSSYIFNNFDSLLLLRRGGQTVFFGRLGEQSSELVKYFTAIPGVRPIAQHQNPASWMLDQIGAGTGGTSTMVDVHEEYRNSALGLANTAEVARLCPIDESNSNPDDQVIKLTSGAASYNASDSVQLYWLLKRSALLFWRTPDYNLDRMKVALLLGLLFGSVYPQQNYNTFSIVLGRAGLIFATTLFIGEYTVPTRVIT